MSVDESDPPRIDLNAGTARLSPMTEAAAGSAEARLVRPFTIRSAASPERPPVVEMAIPVHNEEFMLEASTAGSGLPR